jgi:hypothetical protein
MRRTLCLLLAVLGVASCLAPRANDAASESPAWLDERIAAAEGSIRGYPRLTDVPTRGPSVSSEKAWRDGVTDMAAVRAIVEEEAAQAEAELGADAATFARRSRADTERDLERQRVDE